MSTLRITRGYPGSGKTTLAKKLVQLTDGTTTRVNRDDLRVMLFGKARGLTYQQEQTLTRIQRDAVRTLLQIGKDVIVDDTNLRLRHARSWADLAEETGSSFRVLDVPTTVEDCIHRDAERKVLGERYVGAEGIREIAAKFPQPWPEVKPREKQAAWTPEPYVPRAGDAAYIVDIDGTLANRVEGGRGRFDWSRVGEDEVVDSIASLVKDLYDAAYRIIVMSGRDEVCRPETEEWLKRHKIPYNVLLMRPEGDNRKDSIVKAELFDRHVRNEYYVAGVLDDRQQVVDMWRAMGLTCLQVAPSFD